MLSLTPLLMAAMAANPAPAPPTRIPFANSGGIADWYARDEAGIFLLDQKGDWHYARFMSDCPRLPSLTDIAFDVGATGDFDAFSTVIADGMRCKVDSLVAAPAPAEVGLKGKRR